MVQKKLFRGSIRAVKNPEFYEPDKAKQIRIESNGIEAIIRQQCFSKDLQTILNLHNIKWTTVEIETTRPIKEIGGIAVKIINDGRDSVRIEFSEPTQSELHLKRERIVAWLDKNGIPYGEEGMIVW